MKKILYLITYVSLISLLQSCRKEQVTSSIIKEIADSKEKKTNNVMSGILPAGIYRLVSAPSALARNPKSIGIVNGSALQGAFTEQRGYVENNSQDWLINSLGDGQYTIINIHSGKALDVPFGVAREDVPLWQYAAAKPAGKAQRWKIDYQGQDAYRIKSMLDTTKGLHIKDGAAGDGGRLILKTFSNAGVNSNYNGYFLIYPIKYTKTGALFIGLPDTQTYSSTYPVMLTAQKDWLLANKDAITMAIQHGDLTDANIDSHWTRVNAAFHALDGIVPYALTTGNHDMSTNGTTTDRNTTKFNANFPYSVMSKLPYFGGIYNDPNGSDKMDNSYYLFETGKYKWLLINLEFGPRDAALQWAKKVCDEFADRTAIINTHAYMYYNDTRYKRGYTWNPHNYPLDKLGAGQVNDGEEMWEKLIRITPNIRFVLSGHVLRDACGSLVSKNDAGKYVYQALANFQGGVSPAVPNGGNAYLRKYHLDFVNRKIKVETYSPYLNEKFLDITGRDHNFELALEIVGM